MDASILDFGFRFENYCRGCRVYGVGCGGFVGGLVWEYKKYCLALGAGGCESVYKVYGKKDRTDDWAGY